MIDVSSDHFNIPDWLVHVVVYQERENELWTKSNPIAFTKTYTCASWPNPGKQDKIVYVPCPNKVYAWKNQSTTVSIEAIED